MFVMNIIFSGMESMPPTVGWLSGSFSKRWQRLFSFFGGTNIWQPWHHNMRRLTCWVSWTFRWWPARTGPWLWGSGIQTPHTLRLWTRGYPQCTAWNVSVEKERAELVRVCVNVCNQDGAQTWWGNSRRNSGLVPTLCAVKQQGFSLCLSISVQGWNRQPSLGGAYWHTTVISSEDRTALRRTRHRLSRIKRVATHQLIESHLWAFVIKQVPPCGSAHRSKTHISYRAGKKSETDVNTRCQYEAATSNCSMFAC